MIRSAGFHTPSGRRTGRQAAVGPTESASSPRSALSPRDHFLLAFIPRMVEIHFGSLDLLAAARHDAAGALRTRMTAQEATLRQEAPGIVDRVRKAETLLKYAGLEPPEPPRCPRDSAVWVARVLELSARLVRTGSDHDLGHRLGALCGEVLRVLNLGALAHYLLEVSPRHAGLQAHAVRLGAAQARLQAHLVRLLAHPALTVAQRDTLVRMLAELAAVHIEGSDPHDALLVALQQATQRCSQDASTMAALLV